MQYNIGMSFNVRNSDLPLSLKYTCLFLKENVIVLKQKKKKPKQNKTKNKQTNKQKHTTTIPKLGWFNDY